MIYHKINAEGIVTTISSGGVLLQYAIDAGYLAELYFNSAEQAQKVLGIKDISTLTMRDFLNYYYHS